MLVIALMYFVIVKPIHHEKINSYMSNSMDGMYKYGNAPLRFNNDPSDMNYYNIVSINEELGVPNSQILTNKSLYKYESLLVPRSSIQLRAGSSDEVALKLSDGTHFSDMMTNREDARAYTHDHSFNRYGTIKESYFD